MGDAPVRARRSLAAASARYAPVGGVVLVFAAVSAWLAFGFAGRIRDWAVMTDEMLYEKLAASIATTHSPLPEVHHELVGVVNQLYPLLLAPFFGSMSVPDAFHAAHLLNVPLMVSAAVPTYLLARELVDRREALAVALLSVLVPWMVLVGFLMTEVVAYPAFLWAMLALQRAVRGGSSRRDLIALAGIALAVLARIQFLILALVLPLAILAHELGYALATSRRGERRRALRNAAALALGRHRLLALLYGAAAVSAVLAAVFASLSRVLGVYAITTTQGSLLPRWVWQSTAAHLDSVAIGCGLLPFVIGGGWMLAVLARPRSRRAHAFATLSLLAIVILAVETASFDIRFGGKEIVRDRYLFYIVPLLLAATAAVVRERRTSWLGPGAMTVFFAATVHWLELPRTAGVWLDTPTRVLNGLVIDQAGSLGVHAFVTVAGVLLGVCVVAALRLLPRRVFAPLLLAGLLLFSLFITRSLVDRALAGNSSSGRPLAKPAGTVLDWVDSVLPPGSKAAIVPFPTSSEIAATAVAWWDVEFWNRSVVQAYTTDRGYFHYTPFPSRRLALDWTTGVAPATVDAPPFVVRAGGDSRFALVGARHASNLGLEVLSVERPYRAAWMSRGLQVDGWTTPGRLATIRVFAPAGTGAQQVQITFTFGAPPDAPASYSLAAQGVVRDRRLAPRATANERVELCVPRDSYADIAFKGTSRARIPAPPLTFAHTPRRPVGVSLLGVDMQSRGPCRA